ncbi:class I SAM-dependent DNA methyltransferase [Methanooceanicella nereidis]|nr:class I SAM-dependent methyltransferase [Methanocella sp. CWC-04]
MKSDVFEAHDVSAKYYDSMSELVENRGHEVLFGLTYEYIGPEEMILDIGIGTGLSSYLFHKAGLKVYGIDNSEEMLKACKEKGFVKEIKTYDLISGNWPYADSQFDHAVCCGVFHFFQDLDIFFKETSRLLKKDGTFSFTVIGTMDDEVSCVEDPSGLWIYHHSDGYIERLVKFHGFLRLKSISFYTYKDAGKKEKVLFKAFLLKKRLQE